MDLTRQKLDTVACDETSAPLVDEVIEGLGDIEIPLTLRERMENWGSD